MTPERVSPGGSFRIERRFKGVGEIRMASGARTEAEHAEVLALLKKLERTHRIDLLRAVKARRLTIAELRAADDAQQLDSVLVDVRLHERLWPWEEAREGQRPKRQPGAFESALARMKCGPETKRRYQTSLNALARTGLVPADARVAALAAVDWAELARTWPNGPDDWMHLRRAVSACLTLILGGKRKGLLHPFRIAVMDELPYKKGNERVPDLSPELFWAAIDAAPMHVRAAYVTILLVGTRKSEYLRLVPEDLMPATHQVRIWDGKTEASKAVVPVDPSMWEWVEAGVPAPLAAAWLLKHWQRACVAVGAGAYLPDPKRPGKTRYVGPTIHDLRHCLGQWATNAGTSLSEAQVMLRHASAAMTARYTKQKMRRGVAGVIAGELKRARGA